VTFVVRKHRNNTEKRKGVCVAVRNNTYISLSECTVSSWSKDDGDTQVTITAKARPPRESASKWVNFEFRYGICPPPLLPPVDGDEADDDDAF
jgi:hypothetical protein